jgi:hypothetical protein
LTWPDYSKYAWNWSKLHCYYDWWNKYLFIWNNKSKAPFHEIFDDGIFQNTVIPNPPVKYGFGSGTGDNANYSVFNQAIYPWWSIAFVDTCFKTVKAFIDHRTGNFFTKGLIQTNDLNIDHDANRPSTNNWILGCQSKRYNKNIECRTKFICHW